MSSEEDAKAKAEENRILTVYDLVAKLLPLEGRDYELNPYINARGGVSFDPAYHTEIGKIWIEYLSKTLPKLAKVPPLMRDQYIENMFPEVAVDRTKKDGKNGRTGDDGEAGRPGEDGKNEEPKAI